MNDDPPMLQMAIHEPPEESDAKTSNGNCLASLRKYEKSQREE